MSRLLRIIFLTLLTILFIVIFNQYGITGIKNNIENMGIYAPIGIFVLRSSSIIIPALPGTAYSILAGAIFGFKKAYILICLADLFSCTICFFLARKYGKDFLRNLAGKKFIYRIESFSKKRVENNIFIMTTILMTGFFDFACYTIGLTKTKWVKFLIALIISIIVSNIPIVAFGAGILSEGKKILLLAIVGMIILSFINSKLYKIGIWNNE